MHEAALREVSEEVAVSLDVITVDDIHHDDHGGWSYVTVIATVAAAEWVKRGLQKSPPPENVERGFARGVVGR